MADSQDHINNEQEEISTKPKEAIGTNAILFEILKVMESHDQWMKAHGYGRPGVRSRIF